jgi:hypothetical protein
MRKERLYFIIDIKISDKSFTEEEINEDIYNYYRISQ